MTALFSGPRSRALAIRLPRTASATRRMILRSTVGVANAVKRARDPRRTVVPPKLLRKIQEGTMAYRYRGIPCIKNPFDLAIYLSLLNTLKPKTIIEIGSASGGSAKFFADQTGLLGIGTKVWSLDIYPVLGLDEKNLTFLEGDIHRLEDSPLPGILAGAVGPILVIEDGPHTFEGSSAALEFFGQHLRIGDMIVIEDGNLRDLGDKYLRWDDGPNRAVKKFMSTRTNEFTIRVDLCDSFGKNVTWNTDGYLQKIG